jgi:hypothetical protein
MTATRWWVRLGARWLARVDAVKGQIQMVSLAVTAFSTFSLLLQSFGLGRFVAPIGVGGVVGALAYAYLYSEGGVWNQVSRDRADMASDWSGPSQAIATEMTARALRAAERGEELDPDERRAVRSEVDAAYGELRDGWPGEVQNS